MDSDFRHSYCNHKYSCTIIPSQTTSRFFPKQESLLQYLSIKKSVLPVTPKHSNSLSLMMNKINEFEIPSCLNYSHGKKFLYYEKVDELQAYKEKIKKQSQIWKKRLQKNTKKM